MQHLHNPLPPPTQGEQTPTCLLLSLLFRQYQTIPYEALLYFLVFLKASHTSWGRETAVLPLLPLPLISFASSWCITEGELFNKCFWTFTRTLLSRKGELQSARTTVLLLLLLPGVLLIYAEYNYIRCQLEELILGNLTIAKTQKHHNYWLSSH